MIVKNQTHWQTRDLKRVFCETLRRNSKIEGKLRMRMGRQISIFVEVVYSRRSYSGWAQYGGIAMHLRVLRDELNGAELACLFEHELEHIRGYRHRSMSRAWQSERFAWATNAEKFPFRRKEMKPVKPKADTQLKRYANVLKKVAEKERALKRLQRLLKKWRQKQRYYEKVLVAASKLPERRRK